MAQRYLLSEDFVCIVLRKLIISTCWNNLCHKNCTICQMKYPPPPPRALQVYRADVLNPETSRLSFRNVLASLARS